MIIKMWVVAMRTFVNCLVIGRTQQSYTAIITAFVTQLNLNCIILKNKKFGRISDYFLWNCCHVNIKGPPLWRVSIGSGNGLVSCEVTGPQWVTCIYVCMLNGWIYHVMLSSCFLKWTFSYPMLDGLAGLKPRALEFTYKANVDIAWQSWCYMARYEYPDWLITRIFLPSTHPYKSMFESNRT